jgi:hypothetical protein
MTYREGGDDDAVRRALHDRLPADVELRFDRIDARADRMRRNNRVRGAIAFVTVGAVALLAAATLRPGAAHDRLDVSVNPPRSRATATSPTTAKVPRTTPPTHPVIAPLATAVPTVGPSPTPTTNANVVSPTTLRAITPIGPHTTVAPPAPTTTVAPAPTHIRITLVLDDTGLHAPTSLATADLVDVVFIDQRTSKPQRISVRVDSPDGSSVMILRQWQDVDCCGHFGAIIGLEHPVGVLVFQPLEQNTYAAVPIQPAQTTMTS